MDVYLIPVGGDRYELYCEHIVEEESLNPEAPAGSSRIGAIMHRMKAAVAQAEQEQQSGETPPPDAKLGWVERMRRRMLCWVAERMAEWRLLWRLRKESDVDFFFPDDLSSQQAIEISRAMLQHEADRHLRWTIIDGLLFCASGIVALVPGPNPIAYYFGFRFAGHYYSRRGAKHGLEHVSWHAKANPQLSELRAAIPLGAGDRERRVREVAAALQLQHLPRFFERTAIPAA